MSIWKIGNSIWLIGHSIRLVFTTTAATSLWHVVSFYAFQRVALYVSVRLAFCVCEFLSLYVSLCAFYLCVLSMRSIYAFYLCVSSMRSIYLCASVYLLAFLFLFVPCVRTATLCISLNIYILLSVWVCLWVCLPVCLNILSHVHFAWLTTG